MLALLSAAMLVRVVAAEPVDPAGGPELEDPTGLALASFYDALHRTSERAAKTRVLHMGDSTIALDGVPHAIRRRLQQRFGDGGAGFVAMSLATTNLRHSKAQVHGSGWEVCYIARLCRNDGRYGLGGYVHRARTRARSKVATRSGHPASHLELWYSAAPGGGRMRVRVDREPWVLLDTDGGVEDRWHAVDVPAGAHSMEVRTIGPGRVVRYGFVLETDQPGVVWDTVSMWGAFTKRLRGYDDDHLASQVAHRHPDLVVLNYGGNDMRRIASGAVDGAGYKAELRDGVAKLREDEPDRACLVVSVVDHVHSGGRKVTPEHVRELVSAQRQVAYAQGCAFFDSVAAMGGPGGLRAWARRGLVSADRVHLNGRGRELMGEMMFLAILRGYEGYLSRTRSAERGGR